MAGSTKLLIKLNEALLTHKYYEAHQLVKTLNFRYISSGRYEELETLLKHHSTVLLDSKQFESGMDVAILLVALHKTAENKFTDLRIETLITLYKKMPNSPERGQFLHQALEWTVPSSVSSKLNQCAAETLIAENNYEEAWRHVIRLNDGKQAALFAMQIIHGLGPAIKREELGLITAHLVVSFLATKRVPEAEQALITMIQTQDCQHLSPLCNGVRYLVEAAKSNDPPAFQGIQTLYDISFSRDPNLRRLVGAAGKSLFHLNDERANNPGGGGLMSLFSAFMNPDMSN